MAQILVLGAGLGGLSTAMLLARDGHEVTVLERDPAPPPVAGSAEAVGRLGAARRQPVPAAALHAAALVGEVRAELPEVLDGAGRGRRAAAQRGRGCCRRRGAARCATDDERFDTVTARRPVLEAARWRPRRRAGVTVRRGVDGDRARDRRRCDPVPRVDRRAHRRRSASSRADLVVDCGGRRSALGAWLAAAGARPPGEEREDCGLRLLRPPLPRPDGTTARRADRRCCSTTTRCRVLTLPADNGTWSVVLTAERRDNALRALRDPAVWHARWRAIPLAAHWADGEPITGVDVMAGIEDRFRRLRRRRRPGRHRRRRGRRRVGVHQPVARAGARRSG